MPRPPGTSIGRRRHGSECGAGRASLAPPEVAAELFRFDTLGVLMPEGHHLAAVPGVPIATLAAKPSLLAEEKRAPELHRAKRPGDSPRLCHQPS